MPWRWATICGADPASLMAALGAAFDIASRLSLGRLAMTPIGLERGVFGADEAAAHLVEVIEAGRGAASRCRRPW